MHISATFVFDTNCVYVPLFYALGVFLIKWGLIIKAPIKNGIAIINNGMVRGLRSRAQPANGH
jgi:hypothetical protein